MVAFPSIVGHLEHSLRFTLRAARIEKSAVTLGQLLSPAQCQCVHYCLFVTQYRFVIVSRAPIRGVNGRNRVRVACRMCCCQNPCWPNKFVTDDFCNTLAGWLEMAWKVAWISWLHLCDGCAKVDTQSHRPKEVIYTALIKGFVHGARFDKKLMRIMMSLKYIFSLFIQPVTRLIEVVVPIHLWKKKSGQRVAQNMKASLLSVLT